MKQGSIEWLDARNGKITASQAFKIMGARGLGKTGESYICELIASDMGAIEDIPETYAMRYGHETEPIAREYFELSTNCDVIEKGFISPDFNKNIGFSPDGYIKGKKIGIEIKCPLKPANHVKHMTIKNADDLKKIEPQYYWQVMFSLYCSGFDSWYFISFNPQFTGINRMIIVSIQPNESDFELIKERLLAAKILKSEIESKIK